MQGQKRLISPILGLEWNFLFLKYQKVAQIVLLCPENLIVQLIQKDIRNEDEISKIVGKRKLEKQKKAKGEKTSQISFKDSI
jgi:hypothetical protein